MTVFVVMLTLGLDETNPNPNSSMLFLARSPMVKNHFENEKKSYYPDLDLDPHQNRINHFKN